MPAIGPITVKKQAVTQKYPQYRQPFYKDKNADDNYGINSDRKSDDKSSFSKPDKKNLFKKLIDITKFIIIQFQLFSKN